MNDNIPAVGEGVEYSKLKKWHCRAILDTRGSDGLPLSCGRPKGLDHEGRECSYCPAHMRRFLNCPPGIRSYYGKAS